MVVGLPQAALGHWEFTEWGMSPEQVARASHGQATPTSPEERVQRRIVNEGWAPQLKSAWQSGPFRFAAYFYFEGANALALVVLNLEEGDPRSWIGALKATHGDPVSESATWSLPEAEGGCGGDAMCVTEMGVWHTPTDEVRYLHIRALREVRVFYRPR